MQKISKKEELVYKPKNVWLVKKKKDMKAFAEDYKNFVDVAKTERLTADEAEKLARDNGFVKFEEFMKKKKKKKKGADPVEDLKIYVKNRNKSMALFRFKNDIRKGMNLVGAHLDSPRIDLKPRPFIEDSEVALAKTHYYGGIKKYQWLNIPLALHGIIIKGNGDKLRISIGEKADEPTFVISDLLPHLDKDSRDKPISKVYDGEKLNVIIGTIPAKVVPKNVKEKVKYQILRILNNKYGIIEEDLVSAELELVPAFKPRYVGFDNSLIGAYGHDDRVCAYTAVRGLIDATDISRTSAAILFDKEEIGSEGNTGAKAHFWFSAIRRILRNIGYTDVEGIMDEAIANSLVLSADVNVALNPTFKEAHELNNAAKVGYGIVLTKYTGSYGKALANDAHAEIVGKLRALWNEEGVIWQPGELGKVDQGGGGTVAKYFAQLGTDVIDCGPGIIGMHSPFELLSVGDLYETYLAYRTFFSKFV